MEQLNSTKQRIVVCAAIRSVTTGLVVTGARHYDEIMIATLMRLVPQFETAPTMKHEFTGAEQGFIDQFGVFMDRQEALEVAQSSGQIRYKWRDDMEELFSENLY